MPAKIIITTLISTLLAGTYMYYISGMPLFCDCNYLNFWNGFADDAGNSQRFIDWYTLSHIITGILLVLIFKPFLKKQYLYYGIIFMIIVAAIWEVIESTDYIIFHFRTATISRDYIGDSILNAISDILAILLGAALTFKVRTSLLLILIVCVELASFYFIRDNLTTNILSFIVPGSWLAPLL